MSDVHMERDGHVAVLSLDNPPLNIMTAQMRAPFLAALDEVRRDSQVRAVVLTGRGDRAFCAGADLNEEADLTPETVRAFLDEDCAIYDGVAELPVPVVAAINGHCMGGGLELALSCDLRVVAEDAKLCGAGVKVGLVVSTTRMTRLVGPAVAKDLLLTGRTFLGDEAVRLGLATSSTPRSQVLSSAVKLGQLIARRAPLAVRRTKQAIDEAAELPFAEAMSRELDHFAELSETNDHKHAIAAFFDRQPPSFTGE
ncbi:enoyl-CoA hydratase/isomerase family protein [Ornithinicoccus halotolerans]|uniref:enoyl-CoA hydratase/isomerase family protein n=1 Tax=Ornithinicoccus halotolerans TaxID=1748220 RepID=UPI001297A104|nr:enoyl-CoA hydratase/isomerase family protein [Ornithinicoccus halotolerans]